MLAAETELIDEPWTPATVAAQLEAVQRTAIHQHVSSQRCAHSSNFAPPLGVSAQCSLHGSMRAQCSKMTACRPASRDASRGSFTARISVSKQVNNVETEDVPAETLTNTRDMIVAVLLLFVKCDQSFCRATLCIRAVYAVVQWLSVRLVRVLCRNG